MAQTDAQIQAHPDKAFIRAAIAGARYLDKQSRAIAREALRRFDAMNAETK